MNICSLSVLSAGTGGFSSPAIVLRHPWLPVMGFTPGALVQVLPEARGLFFVLCNKNIGGYSKLLHDTENKKGGLITVGRCKTGARLGIDSFCIRSAGLDVGDNLIARYEYGLIRFRKLPGGSVNGSVNGSVKLVSSHIVGPWLVESGFLPNAVFTLSAVPGLITCTLMENDIRRIRERAAEMVKHARLNKLQLLQVQASNYHTKVGRQPGILTYFDIPSVCLDKAGFSPNEMLLAFYEPGLVKIRQPDFVALGF